MAPEFDFEELRAFKIALEVLVAADAFCRHFDGHRRRGAFQLYGAASSIVENLTEATGRRGPKDRAHYVDIANGSAHEVAWRG
jgi:four helix bundle protein